MLIACLVVGSVLGTATVCLLGMLALRPQKQPDAELSAKVHNLELELENVFDQVLSWRKKEGSRARRENEEPPTPIQKGNGSPGASREDLKMRLLQIKRGGLNG